MLSKRQAIDVFPMRFNLFAFTSIMSEMKYAMDRIMFTIGIENKYRNKNDINPKPEASGDSSHIIVISKQIIRCKASADKDRRSFNALWCFTGRFPLFNALRCFI